MSEERLKEIKDSFNIKFIEGCRSIGKGITIQHINQELELYNEVIGLKKRNKEIYEGFLATQEEMSDYAGENEKLKSRIDKAVEYINNFSVDKSFSFPLMKRWEENQVKSSIDYEFNDTLKKDLLNILNGKE